MNMIKFNTMIIFGYFLDTWTINQYVSQEIRTIVEFNNCLNNAQTKYLEVASKLRLPSDLVFSHFASVATCYRVLKREDDNGRFR